MQCWQILERMINQNIFDDIAQDYRYYEDPSDEFREEEGTLLPLWKFSYEKTKKMHITDICFNTLYYDLFAVCYGSRKYHHLLVGPKIMQIHINSCVINSREIFKVIFTMKSIVKSLIKYLRNFNF